jgi:iron complex transport system ATP-binding protein
MLSIRNLTVSYAARRVLTNVSLEVAAGELVALIGPNGAGKSTFLRAVSGIAPFDAGEILLDGAPLARLSSQQRARRVAVVPQAASLPPAFTVWETVLLGRAPYLNFLGQTGQRDEAAARAALERVDALELAERRMGELSGGEQQRVLLARALAQDTPILLLDEPTTHLDLKYQFSLMDTVAQLACEHGVAVLAALHDLNLAARYAKRVALLVEGEIKALGSPEQALRADVISRAYGWQVDVIPHPTRAIPLILPNGYENPES